VLGVDRSARMLAQAAADAALSGAWWARASAEALPLRPRSLDLVFAWLVYHHLDSGPAAVREWARVLRPGGMLVMGQSTQEILDRIPWMPFFPAARAVDGARMPARAAVADAAAAAGLARARVDTIAFSSAPSWPRFADRLARRGISSLQLIGDDEFAAGLSAFRAWCAARPADEPARSELDLFVFAAPA
jgi:SAM-dependent methyltransferase